MKRAGLTIAVCLTMVLALSSGNLFAQKILRFEAPGQVVEEPGADAAGNVIIFSNLGPTSTDRYDSRTFAKLTVAGKSVIGVPETWVAVNFIPKRDVQAKVLLAAITYVSGTSW